ncbi:F-box domain-containing protein [Mycena indigotica]|uniref:F-box domain-containing protein n=1 Tax=Mycena indigotica TaxID=2126181 RepID=A0A8H6SNT5_9AGAR|nr:F-box domain-containing protein [Mycena indigotica]KAF7302036.1 F-box domain-containing protein [Mycena indigotica]
MHLSFVELNLEIIHRICEELVINDVLSLRQTCRSMNSATRSRIVWIRRLEILEAQWALLPSYAQGYRLLRSDVLEALVFRLTSVANKWARHDMTPIKSVSLVVPHSITWLRIVDGRYVFVAYSDQKVSVLACWDFWWLQCGDINPIALAFLPGCVDTAQVEMQENGVVLALGLDGENPSVLVTTLQEQENNTFAFYELARIEKSSHILMLKGSFLGCAIRDGANLPHLVNWKDSAIREVPEPPGGLSNLVRASVPHLIALSGEALVIVRSIGVEIYHCPTNGPIVFVRHITGSTIWEAVATPITRLQATQLTFITRVGIETLTIDDRALDTGTSTQTPSLVCVARAPLCPCLDPMSSCCSIYHAAPWYGLCVGDSGRRCMWISTARVSGKDYSPPCFVSARLPSPLGEPSDHAEVISWPMNPKNGLALWALPRFDFNEAFGITVVGNCFGELEFYDLDEHLLPCLWLSRHPFWRSEHQLTKVLSSSPLTLDVLPQPVASSPESLPDCTAHWSQDPVVKTLPWEGDWTNYKSAHLWQGMPCDYAWIFREAFGFPGRVIPQLYGQRCPDEPEQTLFFRVGNRYFVLREDEENEFRFWPLVANAPQEVEEEGDTISSWGPSSKLSTTRRTAFTLRQAYIAGLYQEVFLDPCTRNRWLEMKERGGYVEWQNLSYQAVGSYFD